jgi:hypothetical protein
MAYGSISGHLDSKLAADLSQLGPLALLFGILGGAIGIQPCRREVFDERLETRILFEDRRIYWGKHGGSGSGFDGARGQGQSWDEALPDNWAAFSDVGC